MPPSTTTSPSGIERPEVIRALVESRALPFKALLDLSLTNKTVRRLVFQESLRLSIKHVPIAHTRRSPLWCAIESDYPRSLQTALELGEFDKDTTSTNARMLHANGGRGVHILLSLCITHGSGRCFSFLLKWISNPAIPFTYDAKWLYEKAKHTALGEGRVQCLLFLYDSDKDNILPDPTPLYSTLLHQARSPTVVSWISHRMPPDTDYRPVLIAQCGIEYTQPALIETLMDLVPKSKLSLPDSSDEAVDNSTALSAAASALHIPAIEMLLRRGARMFPSSAGNSLDTAAANALFSAVSHRLPRESREPMGYPYPRASTDEESEEDDDESTIPSPNPLLVHRTKLRKWHTETAHLASRMYTAATYLVDAAELEVSLLGGSAQDRKQHQQQLTDMLDTAALLYLHNLRSFLLKNLPWVLSSPTSVSVSTAPGQDTTTADKRAALLNQLIVSTTTPNNPPTPTPWQTFLTSIRDRNALYDDSDFDSDDSDSDSDLHSSDLSDSSPSPSPTHPHAPKQTKWFPSLSARSVRSQLAAQGVHLPPRLEDIWVLLATPATAKVAGEYLRVEGDEEGSRWGGVGLWELVFAGEVEYSEEGRGRRRRRR